MPDILSQTLFPGVVGLGLPSFAPTGFRGLRFFPLLGPKSRGRQKSCELLLKDLRATAGGCAHVLPRFIEWDRGESARILRKFCLGIGVTSVKFHALRACFATQLPRDSAAPAVVMKICGWKDLKTMQRYVRLAGIEIEGTTDSLKILPPAEVMGRVVELFAPQPEAQ